MNLAELFENQSGNLFRYRSKHRSDKSVLRMGQAGKAETCVLCNKNRGVLADRPPLTGRLKRYRTTPAPFQIGAMVIVDRREIPGWADPRSRVACGAVCESPVDSAIRVAAFSDRQPLTTIRVSHTARCNAGRLQYMRARYSWYRRRQCIDRAKMSTHPRRQGPENSGPQWSYFREPGW